VVIFRRLLGEVLRAQRMRQGRTLRQISADARVSLGYISEIERGQKEASSELLASICAALDVPLSEILSEVSDAVALEEAALAMQLESIQVDTTSLRGPRSTSRPNANTSCCIDTVGLQAMNIPDSATIGRVPNVLGQGTISSVRSLCPCGFTTSA